MESIADWIVGHYMIRDVYLNNPESSGVHCYDWNGRHQI